MILAHGKLHEGQIVSASGRNNSAHVQNRMRHATITSFSASHASQRRALYHISYIIYHISNRYLSIFTTVQRMLQSIPLHKHTHLIFFHMYTHTQIYRYVHSHIYIHTERERERRTLLLLSLSLSEFICYIYMNTSTSSTSSIASKCLHSSHP